jgi:membrane-associated protease RseP (regulator of RpoE activity)
MSDWKAGVEKLMSMGYAYLGYASFEAGAKDYGPQLREKAKELGADVVLVTSSFARNVSGVMPLLNYQPGQVATTYSSGQVNANAYNNRGTSVYGTANYSGQSTTTTSGTFSTNYVPYSVDRYSYGAGFFRKRSFIFGARWVPLDTNQRQQLQRNTGLVVVIVVDGTPAFLANILPGDILLTIDGQQITTDENFRTQTNARAGKKVSIGLLRNGKEMTIEMELGLPPPDKVEPKTSGH